MERGRWRGGDMCVWMCCIKLGMVGLAYFMAKCGKLRRVGLDIVEGLVSIVDVFDKYILEGKAELIFQNARCKERTKKLCVFRDGIYFSRIVSLNSVNQFIFVMVKCCVFFAVRTEFLNII
jgi:hypothetical protein